MAGEGSCTYVMILLPLIACAVDFVGAAIGCYTSALLSATHGQGITKATVAAFENPLLMYQI